MEIIHNLALGFASAVTLQNLLWCFTGVVAGTLVGVLPGLGPLAALSILLPLAYHLPDPTAMMIFMAALYYGAQYGGSTTAILLNIPGESASLITTLDGHAMTRNGRAGAALAIAAGSSLLGGCVATVLIMFLAVPLAELAFVFGPAEYASLMIMGLLASVALTQASLWHGLGMVCLGILLGLVGTDVHTGLPRFTADVAALYNGINFALLAMGIFGLGEIAYAMTHGKNTNVCAPRFRELWPTGAELQRSLPAALRGTTIGSIMGILPGTGATLSSLISYVFEKKISRCSDKFGQGDPAGVAAPEAANNAGAQTSFIPMLSLGIPMTPMMAVMLAGLMMIGIQPGPGMIEANHNLFWALIASMWIGNFFLFVLNLPLIAIWTSVLSLPRNIVYCVTVLACVTGAYYINNNLFDVWLLIPLTLLGYGLKLLQLEPAPMALGFVIGPMFEEFFRRSLSVSQGDWMFFLERPISLTFLLITVSVLCVKLSTKATS